MINKQDEEDVNEVDVEEGVDSPEATDTEDENDTQPLSSDGENEEEETEEYEGEEDNDASTTPEDETDTLIAEEKPLQNETLREFALRKELENVRKQIRTQKQDDIFVKDTNHVSNEDDVLSDYDPDEVNKLEKIISKLGYVKNSELQSKTYESTANEELSNFIDTHPEYLAENDKDGILWNEFRSEFNMYKKPESPKEYKKIFERIHNGIKTTYAIDFKKINASREKLKVASHNGAAKIGSNPQRKSQNTSGIRTDMLQGFSDEEKAELLS